MSDPIHDSHHPEPGRVRATRRDWSRLGIGLVAAGLLVGGLLWFTDQRAGSNVEGDRQECRAEVMADGASPTDVDFDLKVAACALGKD